jgi:cold shock CspA family protein
LTSAIFLLQYFSLNLDFIIHWQHQASKKQEEVIMQTGTVKMFDHLKGYGFIRTADEDDLYFNQQDIHPKYRNVLIKENMKVGFDLKRELRGDRAANVRIL